MSDNLSYPIIPNYVQWYQCANIYISTYLIRTILLLPVSTFILFLGFQKWRQHRLVQSPNHFAIFTYHLAAMEVIWVIGFLCQIGALYHNHLEIILVTEGTLLIAIYGELLFHILTCMERYIAVVYPITYLKMKTIGGARIRNISIGCVWLLCLFMISLNLGVSHEYKDIPLYCLLALSLLVTSFCTISVLCVLTRSHHGEGGGEKRQPDQSKRRPFYTITITSAVQWLWFIGLLVSKFLIHFLLLKPELTCLVVYSTVVFNLPSCMVMPLLYLYRAGKCSHGCITQ